MKKIRRIRFCLCVLLMMGLLWGCAPPASNASTDPSAPEAIMHPEEQETQAPATIPTQTTVPFSPVDIMLQEMSLREKVGQLFIIAPDMLDPYAVTTFAVSTSELLKQYPVGGFILFSNNIQSPEQLTAFLTSLQTASKIPPFLSIDEEGGLVARLANSPGFDLPQYESASAVGADGNSSAALEMGSTIGAYLKQYGFNMDFAPVADVNTNPDNPVIGARAFSADAASAAVLSRAMADGLTQQGIIPVFKHFPGHGDTAQDSHSDLAITYKTEAELSQCEWLPFQQTTDLDAIMVGHIAVPSIDGDLIPATMSHTLVTDILTKRLGFDGLIITDSLSMGAIIDSYPSGEAALGALRAGCHILLMPEDFTQAFDTVVSSVESGALPQQQLDEIIHKILEFKLAHGILE